MSVLVSDPASIMRATGLVRGFAAGDDDIVNAILLATLDTENNENTEAFYATFGALIWLSASLADILARAGRTSVDQVLADITGPAMVFERPRLPTTGQPESMTS